MLKNPYGNIEELTKLIEDRRAGGDHHSADVDILMEQVKGTREAPTFGSATRTERWYNPTQWLGMGNDERLALAKDIAALKQAKEFNKALGGFTQKEILELTKRPEGFKLTNENLPGLAKQADIAYQAQELEASERRAAGETGGTNDQWARLLSNDAESKRQWNFLQQAQLDQNRMAAEQAERSDRRYYDDRDSDRELKMIELSHGDRSRKAELFQALFGLGSAFMI